MFKDENRHYSLRKLSVGLASVLIGISFVSGNSHTVKADTVKDGSNGAQTVVQTTANDSNAVVKGRDAAAEANVKDDTNAVTKANAESTPKEQSQTSGAVKKNSDAITQDIRQKAVKASEAIAKVQNNTVKDNSDKTTLNAKGSKAIAESTPKEQSQTSEVVKKNSDALTQDIRQKVAKASEDIASNMLKEAKTEVKENQDWTDSAKNKLQMSTLKAITNKKLNAKMLATSKAISQANDTNGGFDEATWGKLDVNNWQGSVQDDYYQLTDYTGDANHVIVPNEADFAKAGISTSGKQVGVTSDLMYRIFAYKATATDTTVAFSKTDNKQVKAINADWSNTWHSHTSWSKGAELSKFDGTNLDVSNVTNMSTMFYDNQISDLSSLANWNVNNVTDMSSMFRGNPMVDGNLDGNQISDLSPLANWNVNNVTDMSDMFADNQINDLSPLAKWNVNNVTDMADMFEDNQISNLSLLDNWHTDHVTNMANMFAGNLISDLRPLANWNINNVTTMGDMFAGNQISDLSPLAKWDVSHVNIMDGMFENNQISDLSPLANWNTSNVTAMDGMFENCSNLSDISPLANWDTSKVTSMFAMFENTPLKKVTLTNWDFSNLDPSYSSIFPDTNFEVTLSDKTSKSVLDIASKLSDSAKVPIVDGVPDIDGEIQRCLNSIKRAKEEYQQQLAFYKQQIDYSKKENIQGLLEISEQEYQSYLTGDGKKRYDQEMQNLQGELEQSKQKVQQKINQYKLRVEYPLNSVFGNHSKITTPNRDLLVYLVGKLPVKSDSATRTIEITFPNGTKQTINQSVGYGKYAISGTADMATHKLDMAMPYELSKWELIKKEDGSYDLVKAHVDKNGVASFDNITLPKIPGYKIVAKTVANPVNPASALFAISFMALPKPVTPVQNDAKPAKTVTPATPVAIEVAKPIKTEPKVATTPKIIDLSDDAVSTTPKEAIWQVANNLEHDTYYVSNGKYTVELPHISNAQLHVIANDSTKDSVLFTYKGQNTKYVFNIKFVNGHYLLTTYEIKSDKLVKLIDYNFIKSSKMIKYS